MIRKDSCQRKAKGILLWKAREEQHVRSEAAMAGAPNGRVERPNLLRFEKGGQRVSFFQVILDKILTKYSDCGRLSLVKQRNKGVNRRCIAYIPSIPTCSG